MRVFQVSKACIAPLVCLHILFAPVADASPKGPKGKAPKESRPAADDDTTYSDGPRFTDDGKYLASFKQTPARTLVFPKNNLSFGGLIISNQSPSGGQSTSYKAAGTIRVEANQIVTFCPSTNFYKYPHALDGMPANSFDNVVVRYLSMDDQEEGKADTGVAALNHFTGISSLDCSRSEVSDKGLSALKDLVNLETLDLFSSEVSGSFLKEMTNSKKLKLLRLSHDSLAPGSLNCLPQFPNLRYLNLGRTNIDTQMLRPIAACKNIYTLDLSRNPNLDDGAIDIVLQLPKLKQLRLKYTKISAKGLAKLKEAGKLDMVSDKSLVGATPEQIKAGKRKTPDSEDTSFTKSIFSPMSRGRGL
jgi:hypothetical protein